MKSFTSFFIFDSQKVARACALPGKVVKHLHTIACDFLRGKEKNTLINYYEKTYDYKNGKRIMKIEYFIRQSGAYAVLIAFEDDARLIFLADWAIRQDCECGGKGVGYNILDDSLFCTHFNKQAPFVEFNLGDYKLPKDFKICQR